MNDSGTKSIVDRVLQVLACVARAGRPMGAKRIASQVGLPLSTVYRHLAVLKKWGLLQPVTLRATFYVDVREQAHCVFELFSICFFDVVSGGLKARKNGGLARFLVGRHENRVSGMEQNVGLQGSGSGRSG